MKAIKLINWFIFILFYQAVFSQNNDIVKSFDLRGDNSFEKIRGNTNVAKALKNQLNIPENYEFELQIIKGTKDRKSEKDDLGYVHERYAQNYKGNSLASLEELSVNSPEIVGVDFSVYPNPNDGNFTIKIAGGLQPYTLEIFNNMGGLLGVVDCNGETVNVNRTDLDAGIYFVKITMNGKIAVKKMIVQ